MEMNNEAIKRIAELEAENIELKTAVKSQNVYIDLLKTEIWKRHADVTYSESPPVLSYYN